MVLSSARKEHEMSNDGPHVSRASESPTTSRVSASNQRSERFTPSGPIHARVGARSGDVTVRAGTESELVVTLSASSSKYAHLLEGAEIHFDPARQELTVRTVPRDLAISSRGLRGATRSWFDFGHGDLDVLVLLPAASSLEVTTVSGDVSIKGELSEIGIDGVSGDVRVADPCERLEARTASGDVTTAQVHDELKVRSASGDVLCRGAATKTDIQSASGDVDVAAERPGDINIKAVSGDVRVRVARGLAVDINGNSVSGDLGTNIDLDATGDVTSDEETITIKVNTVSGDIRIDKAS